MEEKGKEEEGQEREEGAGERGRNACWQVVFLGATKHLYNWLCPLVGWLVGLWGNAFIRRSTRRTFLAYLALFSKYFHNQILARSLTKW